MTICTCGHLQGHHDITGSSFPCKVCSECQGFQTIGDLLTPIGEQRRLHDGEPVFVIRAQDLLAPQAIAAYARLARTAGLDDFAREVESRAVEVLQWQSTHAKLVKRPD